MKLGIITLQDNNNYGNRLQNYAVSMIMKSYGAEVDTIIVKNKEDFLAYGRKKSSIKNSIKTIMPIQLLVFCAACKQRLCGNKLKYARERNFRKFNKQHITMKTYYINQYEQLLRKKELQKYDYFFTGSDQVWNPDWAGDDLYFLTFAPPEKRIAFIASMGVTELPGEKTECYKVLLRQMKYISVREESAVQLINQITGIKADCFFDPVLLVNREHWLKMVKPMLFEIPSKYILSFFLGEEPKEKIEAFAVSHNLKVVHMNQKEYKKYYLLGPEQLLYMIKNAAVVMTDSFHVTAFSIIFQRQFYVFRRKEPGMENMFSRMETLLGSLDLMNRIQSGIKMEEIDVISREQYLDIEKQLAAERKRLDKKMRTVLCERI